MAQSRLFYSYYNFKSIKINNIRALFDKSNNLTLIIIYYLKFRYRVFRFCKEPSTFNGSIEVILFLIYLKIVKYLYFLLKIYKNYRLGFIKKL